jgi:hypothetical protein
MNIEERVALLNSNNLDLIREKIPSCKDTILGYSLLDLACSRIDVPDDATLIRLLAQEYDRAHLDHSLSLASISGKVNCVRVLLAFGAKIETQLYDKGKPPLGLALDWNHWDCARVLLDHGALRFNANTYLPPSLLAFMAHRERARCAAVAFMGATTKGRRIFLDRNVLQLIGRWVWATRGLLK